VDNVNSKFTTTRKNSVNRVYPNTARMLLSGNMLIASKEEGGSFGTNNLAITDPTWDAADRIFLKYSRKNNLDNVTILNSIKDISNKNMYDSCLNSQTYVRNSDHSDVNRWLKRG